MGNWQQKWESWRDMTTAMQQEIKIEAAEKVTTYIKNAQFEEATSVIRQTEILLNELDFEAKMARVEEHLQAFTTEQEVAKSFEASQLQNLEKPFVNVTFDLSEVKSTAIKQFTKRDFKLVDSSEIDMQFLKGNRNFYLTIFNPEEDTTVHYAHLDEKCQYKNIGFICQNEAAAKSATDITNEWLETLEAPRKKFLTINIANLDAMKQNLEILFQ
ncbi:hypothetical protein ACP0AK_05275 [Listeria ivanovii]|uniref:Uncharacterized protein n=1 Tax=Listeria ivanovii (strain ATCC BAA-678 / PAM 55) TaxID=881621 RepID=G2ZCY1_LISIP|nr:hypothetical protein [Listeria ivanovii]AHI55237.1 hypothetical protein AX25_03640 [Listeria ivanovii WSLC3009]AIS64691.1 hypothetical protein JL52_03575 [Listeria ivanovii subsp. ivanovii]MBC1758613.1 hypothetical protein [Listeria ivanovii]MBK3913487.1 hypothetical protein [Listeria ivanovii subsp. ivanovii]MBK3920395.1 hypothetical protein [Listeria ivanovii subsp. ivanovii]